MRKYQEFFVGELGNFLEPFMTLGAHLYLAQDMAEVQSVFLGPFMNLGV